MSWLPARSTSGKHKLRQRAEKERFSAEKRSCQRLLTLRRVFAALLYLLTGWLLSRLFPLLVAREGAWVIPIGRCCVQCRSAAFCGSRLSAGRSFWMEAQSGFCRILSAP